MIKSAEYNATFTSLDEMHHNVLGAVGMLPPDWAGNESAARFQITLDVTASGGADLKRLMALMMAVKAIADEQLDRRANELPKEWKKRQEAACGSAAWSAAARQMAATTPFATRAKR